MCILFCCFHRQVVVVAEPIAGIVDPHPERIREFSVLVICVLSLSSHQYVPQNYGPNQLLPTLRKYVITVYVLVVLVIIVIIVINLVVVELHIIAVVERVATITVLFPGQTYRSR